jgi:hypothetical protein
MAKKGQTKISATQLSKAIDQYLKDCEVKKVRPLKVELAYLLGIDKDTLTVYSKTPSMQSSIKKLEQASEIFINRKLEESSSNQNMMFLAKVHHGYVEAQYSKVDITTNGESIGIVMLPSRQEA